MPVAVVFPIVLWIAVRCRPACAAAAAFIVALVVAYSTARGLGHFGDASVPLPDRTLAAQTIVLAGALCLLILSALFAERREHEVMLEDGNRSLQLVLAQREAAERTLYDRNRQLQLAGKAALVGSFAIDMDAAQKDFSLLPHAVFARVRRHLWPSPRRLWRSQSAIGDPSSIRTTCRSLWSIANSYLPSGAASIAQNLALCVPAERSAGSRRAVS